MTDTQIKIAELTNIKDHLERVDAFMAPVYGANNVRRKPIQEEISRLRTEIIGLQTGTLPFITINESL